MQLCVVIKYYFEAPRLTGYTNTQLASNGYYYVRPTKTVLHTLQQ